MAVTSAQHTTTAVAHQRPAPGGTALATGLTKVTVYAPHRRLDLALPEDPPLAELLPGLLRQAGPGLADEGQNHGGWVLRRADGSRLATGASLSQQGVRDGESLYLGAAREPWPELEYDDVVDAIAAGARRYGRPWTAAATRATGIGVAGVALSGAAALLAAAPGGPLVGLAGLGVGLLLVLGGTVAARAYGDQVIGVAMAGFALPFALAGGARLPASAPVAPRLLLGSAALLVVAALAAVGVGYRLRYPVAGLAAGLLGCLGSVLGYRLPAAGAAAVVLAVLLIGLPAVPLLAIRLSSLPVPGPARIGTPPARPPAGGYAGRGFGRPGGDPGRPVAAPAGPPARDVTSGGAGARPPASPDRPDRAAVHAAVARTDEILTGILAGAALAAAVAAWLVAVSGGTGGRILAVFVGAGLLVRARLFPTVRARLPLLAGGLAAAAAVMPGTAGWNANGPRIAMVLTGLVVAGLAAVLAGARYRLRAPGPYLGRLADAVDAACVVGAIPAACAVLGLYGRLRGIAG